MFCIHVFSEGDQGETILETFSQEGCPQERRKDVTETVYNNTLDWFKDMKLYMDKKIAS